MSPVAPCPAAFQNEVLGERFRWRPCETAFDLFGRLSRPPLRLIDAAAELPHQAVLHAGEALEISGEPGSGKTATLFEILARCVLPVACGGLGAHAVLIDTDGVDLARLALDLRRRHRAARGLARGSAGSPGSGCSSEPEDASEAAFVDGCLRRLHVLRAADRHELTLALHAVLGYIHHGGGAEPAASASPPGGLPPAAALRLLAVDSASRFQWLGRAQQRLPSLADPDAALPLVLADLLQRRSLSLVWTRTPASKPLPDAFPAPQQRDPLTGLCTYALCLRRRPRWPEAGEDAADSVEAMLLHTARAGAGGAGKPAAPLPPPLRLELLLGGGGHGTVAIRPSSAAR